MASDSVGYQIEEKRVLWFLNYAIALVICKHCAGREI